MTILRKQGVPGHCKAAGSRPQAARSTCQRLYCLRAAFGRLVPAACAALALALLLAGCGGAASGPVGSAAPGSGPAGAAASCAPDASLPAQPTPAPSPTLPPLPAGLSWEKEPFLEVDELVPVELSRGAGEQRYCTVGLVSRDGWCEAYRDGKVGLLAPGGEWIADCEYDDVCCGFGEEYVLGRRVDDGSQYGRWDEYVFDENSRLRYVEPGETNPDGSGLTIRITGTAPNPLPCWVESEQQLYWFSDMSLSPFRRDAGGVPQYPLAGVCFADGRDETMLELFGDGWNEEEHWALMVGGQPVSDERYQNMGCVAEGVLPAKKGGKWGCLNTSGEVVIPFEYDASWPSYDTQTKTWSSTGCYNATEGSIVLCQNGEYALYSTDGGELIPFGQFEKLLPVFEGRLWARQNGLWGILRLETAG